jgi:prefoldin subunit 5
MSDNIQITVEDLLRKIGAMAVQGDIYQSQIAALQAKIAEIEAELAKFKDQEKK